MKVSPGLTASQSYLDASPEVVAAVVNGCGPGGWKFDIIPDTVFGLSIKEACNIHDWDYAEGSTAEDKRLADYRFKNNCYAIIDNADGWFNRMLRYHRTIRVIEYYEAVQHFGGDAFWQGKEKPYAEQCTDGNSNNRDFYAAGINDVPPYT